MDLHNYQRQFQRQLERIKNTDEMLEDNKESALKFKDYLMSEGIGIPKIDRYLTDLRKFDKLLGKPFKNADKADIRRVIAEIEQGNLAPESKRTFKILIRKVYKFLRGIDERGVYPEEVRWINTSIGERHKKLPEELLSDDEIKDIIKNCKCCRDKALIASLAESGCRVSEIGTLKLKHVSFEEHGARLTVEGKTGMRKILVISSAPYLQDWINEHPNNDDPEAPLWHNCYELVGGHKEYLSYTRIASILKASAKKAGIKKRIYPHLLRHSRATILASVMSDSSLKNYLGWTQSSRMAAVYIHMSGKDTDFAILKANGIEIKREVKESAIKPVICMRCKTVNEATNKFCKTCSLALDEKIQKEILQKEMQRSQMDDFMTKLMKDPEIMALITQKIKEVKT